MHPTRQNGSDDRGISEIGYGAAAVLRGHEIRCAKQAWAAPSAMVTSGTSLTARGDFYAVARQWSAGDPIQVSPGDSIRAHV